MFAGLSTIKVKIQKYHIVYMQCAKYVFRTRTVKKGNFAYFMEKKYINLGRKSQTLANFFLDP